jgi:o-succinylbenzoate synthase
MALLVAVKKRVFHFAFDARTSRGAMRERASWFIKIWDEVTPEVVGLGECAPLPGLSPELGDAFDSRVEEVARQFQDRRLNLTDVPADLPGITQLLEKCGISKDSSLVFAFETALLDLRNGGTRKILETPFLTGATIPINGLIWMGGLDFMLQQIEIKIRDGYRCIKLKVGGLDFEKECDILQYVRRKYFREEITIRLDANGAFKPEDALYKLQELSKFGIHSIEQPLKVGAPMLPELCAKSPIPIALDEELIRTNGSKRELLESIRPQFIILKPSLHGGLLSCQRWIEEANDLGIGWWITSALESNIGLNAIAQFTSVYKPSLPQGLGTGTIYTDNFSSPLEVSGNGFLSYNDQIDWELGAI